MVTVRFTTSTHSAPPCFDGNSQLSPALAVWSCGKGLLTRRESAQKSAAISCVIETLGPVQDRKFYGGPDSPTVARGKPSLVLGKDWSHDAAMAGHSTFADWPPARPAPPQISADTGMATQAPSWGNPDISRLCRAAHGGYRCRTGSKELQ